MRNQPSMYPTSENSPAANERVWTYFDAYKNEGRILAIARPQLMTFHHVSEETRQKDIELVKKKMSKPFLREQRLTGPDAFAFENFLLSECMRHHVLGGEISPTTTYDDWVSGVDAVVEWPGYLDGPVRLAIDFTSTEEGATITKKSDKLENNISVKYLRSLVETEQGEQKELRASMPLVLLGFDKEIFRLIAEKGELITATHPVRALLLEQASSQIDMQLSLHIQNACTSSRVTRDRKLKFVHEEFLLLGQDASVYQLVDFILEFDEGIRARIFNEKDNKRLQDLLHIKTALMRERTDNVIMDDEWKEAAQKSKTHQILSH